MFPNIPRYPLCQRESYLYFFSISYYNLFSSALIANRETIWQMSQSVICWVQIGLVESIIVCTGSPSLDSRVTSKERELFQLLYSIPDAQGRLIAPAHTTLPLVFYEIVRCLVAWHEYIRTIRVLQVALAELQLLLILQTSLLKCIVLYHD